MLKRKFFKKKLFSIIGIIFYLAACSSPHVQDISPFILTSLDDAYLVTPEEADDFQWVIDHVAPGTTILLEDGEYVVNSHLRFTTENITLRSKSGKREAVVIDGQYKGYLIQIAAPRITIADLTIKRVKHHLIHVVGRGHHATLHNLHLIDARQQFVKANPSGGEFCDFGTVAHCYFELTEEGRTHVDPRIGGCYSGGVDALSVLGWAVRDNRFEGIYCTNGGLPTHMILFWKTSRNPLVERNVIINCARGIGFGLQSKGGHRSYSDNPIKGVDGPVGHIGGIIRKNIIFGNIGKFFDSGIGLEQAWNVTIHDNIVYSTGGTFSSIDSRFQNSNPLIRNNFVRPGITVRDGANPTFEGNTILP